MQLTRLILHNYLVFEGTCEFPLDVHEPNKNVIIIGGKNGAGKTSILDAIRLCLYGAQGVNKKPGREYRNFLQSKINRTALKHSSSTKAFVELQFIHEDKRQASSVIVRRTWTPGSDEDSLFLEVDGRELNLERDYWGEYLKLLIPPGVAQFFIFDGEKIQEIAAEEQSDKTIVDGIKSLLELDVFEHLQSDLENYARQRLQAEAKQANPADYKKADAELELANQNFSACESDLAELENDIRSFESRKSELENKVSKELGAKFQERPKLQRERDTIEEKLKEVQDKFLAMCGELLPFAMLGDLATRLEQRLDGERKTVNWQAAKEATYPQARNLADRLLGKDSQPTTPPLTQAQQELLTNRLLTLWESLFVPPPADTLAELIHELPQSVEGEVRRVLRESRGEVAYEIRDLLERSERLSNQLRSLDTELNRIPAGDPDEDLFREIANVNQTIGRQKERRAELEDKIEKYRNDVADSKRRLADIAAMVETAEIARKQLELSRKIRLVIQDYMDRLTARKASTLEKNVEEMIQKLVRKEDLVSKLEIDPKDFSVTLYGREGVKLKKSDLSAGEKEIYAICLLWGLAKTSGRELPIIIDTPLSRLDSDHRRAIVQKYYPVAGNQVIILSTDTEVDKRYYQMLIPSVEKSFLLDYDPIQGRTKILAGYFWDEI
ncbi:MAG: DNA sulfur modification protein DndD [Candidatus Acidiferrales bacterium]